MPVNTVRLARALVRLYPRTWRARYEDEVLRLLDDAPPGGRALIDLSIALARERVHALTGWRPGEKTRLNMAGLVDMLALGAVGGLASILGVPVGVWLAGHGAVSPDPLWWLILVPMLVPLRGFLGTFAVRHGDGWAWVTVGDVEIAVWLVISLVTSAVLCLPHLTSSGLSVPPHLPPSLALLRGTNVLVLSLGTRRQVVRQRRIAALGARAVARRRAAVGLG